MERFERSQNAMHSHEQFSTTSTENTKIYNGMRKVQKVFFFNFCLRGHLAFFATIESFR